MTTATGTVKSCSNTKAGGHAYAVTMLYPHDPPPPEFDEVTHEVDRDFYGDFRAAKLAGTPVKVTYTPGGTNAVSVVSHV